MEILLTKRLQVPEGATHFIFPIQLELEENSFWKEKVIEKGPMAGLSMFSRWDWDRKEWMHDGYQDMTHQESLGRLNRFCESKHYEVIG